MKTKIEIADKYTTTKIKIIVNALALNEQERFYMGQSHIANLTSYQLAKLKKELPNGSKNLIKVTKVDRISGKPIEGVIYFTL